MIGVKNGYKEQYDRMMRFRVRLQDFAASQKHYEDDMWAFFQSAYHLKDWIKADFPALDKDVEIYITNGTYLKIAADLANRSKGLLNNN